MIMGKRGPLPENRRLKLLKGTDRADRIRHHPRARPGRPKRPKHLDKVARAKWRELAGKMEGANLLAELDGATLAAYCQAYSHWVHCENVVREHGRTYSTPTGQLKPRPEFTAARQWLLLMKEYGKQLGLSPGARLRMDIPAESEPVENPMDVLLRSVKAGGDGD